MNGNFATTCVIAVFCSVLAACGRELPPRSVADFEADRASLDAKLLACRADRRQAIDDLECQHARIAANRIAAAEEAARRSLVERESARQMEALRRQRAASEAQQKVRQQALIDAAERKIALGLPLSDAEARAIGVDPSNSVLAGATTGTGAAPETAPASTAPASAADAQLMVAPAPSSDAQPAPTASAGNGADTTPVKTLAEIRESLQATRDAERDDADSRDD